ncbi:hypothetical protein BRC84_02185 [Halobacteriales archaeon QS_1_68_44]|nr:MAG: hypothetical protein BRC84_02185 [Halobacteriales archaeon QS_1_68_44]
MHRRAVLATAVFVSLLAAGTAVVAAPAAADVDVEHTVGTADDPGQVDVTTRLTVPSGTTGLRVTLPERTDVYETRGFTRAGDRTYEWTRSTDEPFLSYTMAGNVTVDRGAGERHLFAVTDEWAIVRSPRVDLRTPDDSVDATRRYEVEGRGAAGPNITYLGPHEERVREGRQRFRLVIPAAADMAASPRDALDSMENASERVSFGRRDPEVFVVVAPTGVEWAATGLQRGDADLWVRDRQRVDTARNAWVHEYVHTRQEYEPTDATRWTFEAMAEYYAAVLTYEQGRIDYEAFRGRMERGTDGRYGDVRLVDPDTWRNNEGDYEKGALVFGHLDRRLRAETDGSMDRVFGRLGAGELTRSAFLGAVEDAGGTGVRGDAEQYTETTATPQVWSREEHVEAFGGPLIRQSFGGFAVAGPHRSTALGEPRLVAGERLEATVTVANNGTEAGEFTLRFRVDGKTVETRSGTLGPGETTTVTFTRQFGSAGKYELTAGTATATVVVEEPAAARVTDLVVEPESAAIGETVRLRAAVTSSADRPDAGTVAFTADGETVATREVAFAGTTTVEATTTPEAPGEYAVGAGDLTATLSVRDETVQPTTTPAAGENEGPSGGGTGATTPSAADGTGFGVLAVAAVALLGALSLLGRRYP